MESGMAGDEPAAPHLHPIESQRAIAVLEDAREKLLFLSRITPSISEHKQELSQAVGDEISKLMHEQQDLEARYEALTRARQEAEASSNRIRKKEINEELKSLAHALRESAKHLSRSLKENPNVGENLEKIANERDELQLLLQHTTEELKDGQYDSLVHFIQGEKLATQRLADIESQEQAMRKRVKELSELLDSESMQHEEDMDSKAAHIDALKIKLRKLRIETTETSRIARKEAVASTAATARLHRRTEEAKQSEVADVASRKSVELKVHQEVATFLQEQHSALHRKVKDWEERTGSDLASKEEELKAVLKHLIQEEAELAHLTARFNKESEEYDVQQQQLQAAAAAKQAANKQATAERHAAGRLQNSLVPKWRHMLQRREMEKEMKKSKKKGKK